MAPEQARGEDVDHRADLYALGCTFYHLLAGVPAFDGPTPLAVVARHLSDPTPRVREKVPGVPPALARILERLLQKSPQDRHDSYDALLAELEAAAPRAVELAGFWTRGAALAMDIGLALVLLAGCSAVGAPWAAVPLQLAYMTAAHATVGQTPGKFLLRIRVVGLDGESLGWRRALGRTLVSLWMPAFFGLMTLFTAGLHRLTGMLETLQERDLDELRPLLVGVVMGNLLLVLAYLGGLAVVLLHPQKQALHDVFCRTRVVYHMQRPRLPLRL
jgi:uncharacterized RDD family membrane protein YckC